MQQITRLVPVDPDLRLDLALTYLATSPSTVGAWIDGGAYHRPARLAGEPAIWSAARHPDGLCVSVRGPAVDQSALDAAVVQARATFNLNVASGGVRVVGRRDADLRPLIERFAGLPIVRIPDPFEALVWAFLGQQINVGFAARTKQALLDAYGERARLGAQDVILFPTPERLIDVTPEDLRGLQISRQKALYIRDLARALHDRTIDLAGLRDLSDDVAIDRLLRLRGVGRWTAEYLLLRGFGRPDVIPAADMGLRKMIGRLGGIGRNATEVELRARAASWHPWRGQVAIMLWFALQTRD